MQRRTARIGSVGVVVLTSLRLLSLGCLHGCRSEQQVSVQSAELRHFVFESGDNPQLTTDVAGVFEGHTVNVLLPAGTDRSALVPRIEYRGVALHPGSGVAQDFTETVRYIVTAQDGGETAYTIAVGLAAARMRTHASNEPNEQMTAGAPAPPKFDAPEPALDSLKEITSFSIAGVHATIERDEIELTVPFDTHLYHITPEMRYQGAAIAPQPTDPQDFTQPVVYEVTAQDGTTRRYMVRVRLAPNNRNAITHFRVFGIDSTISAERVLLTLPEGTDLTQLAPEITLSGGTVSPESGAAEDFTQPVSYTVMAASGSTQTYTVVVSVAQGSTNDIMRFDVPGAVSTIHGDDIELNVPFGAPDCVFAPSVVHAGVRVDPPSGEPQDFSDGVVYTVTASDGSERRYTARCRTPKSSARGIARFEVLGFAATIIGDDITLTLPNGTNLGGLAPQIAHYGVRISPASGAFQNFFAPVEYRLVEADGSTHVYTATITVADPSSNEVVDFAWAGRHAQIAGNQVTLTLPAGSDVRALAPTVMHRGVRVVPVSGTTRDFSAPVVYSVIAQDGHRRDYAVTVQVADPSAHEVSDFALLGVPANAAGDELSVTLPYGTDLRALVPSVFEHTGVRVAPPVDEPQDFTQPVQYVVAAADGSTRSYSVHAQVSDISAKDLLGLRILGVDAEITGDRAELWLPAGTDVRGLVPSLVVAGQSVLPRSSLPEDFSQPAAYAVHAADGSVRSYSVAVHVLPQPM